MMTLMRWRTGKSEPHARDVGRIEVISYVECALVIADGPCGGIAWRADSAMATPAPPPTF